MTVSLIVIPHPEIDLAMLDYAIWHHAKLDEFLDGEEVLIRFRDTDACHKAFWSREEWQFYIGDGCIHPSKVYYRKAYPGSVIERAALNHLASLRRTPDSEVEALKHDNARLQATNTELLNRPVDQMPDTEAVERVARAICIAVDYGMDIPSAVDYRWEWYRKHAEAALSALPVQQISSDTAVSAPHSYVDDINVADIRAESWFNDAEKYLGWDRFTPKGQSEISVAGCKPARATISRDDSELTSPVGQNPRTSRAPAGTVSENNEITCANDAQSPSCSPVPEQPVDIRHICDDIDAFLKTCEDEWGAKSRAYLAAICKELRGAPVRESVDDLLMVREALASIPRISEYSDSGKFWYDFNLWTAKKLRAIALLDAMLQRRKSSEKEGEC